MTAVRTLHDLALARPALDGSAMASEYRRHHRCRTRGPNSRRIAGAAAAAVLDSHFARPEAIPDDLLDAFHDIHVPVHRDPHLTAVTLRADPGRVRATGTWLLRNSVHQCSATIGLALLAEGRTPDDVPLIRTIGRLGEDFAPLAAFAVKRRDGGVEALIRLAEETGGWARVYYVEALCESPRQARDWLLRNACDGDYLSGYFAGRVATVTHLHEAITAAGPDEALIDHTGRLLAVMTYSNGMGSGIGSYPPARMVLDAYARHLARMAPTLERWRQAAYLGDFLFRLPPETIGCTEVERTRLVRRFREILARRAWRAAAREQSGPGDEPDLWHGALVLKRLRGGVVSGG